MGESTSVFGSSEKHFLAVLRLGSLLYIIFYFQDDDEEEPLLVPSSAGPVGVAQGFARIKEYDIITSIKKISVQMLC